MSSEAANMFIQKIMSDAEFRKTVLAQTDTDARIDFIHKTGFEFTVDELAQVLPQADGMQLSDNELEQISGGWHTPGADWFEATVQELCNWIFNIQHNQ